MDLSRIPFSYHSVALEDLEHRIIYYESSRGCPFSCSYCLSSIDKQVRFRDLELVKEELCYFLDARVPQVKFVDRTFNCKKSHAMAIWKFADAPVDVAVVARTPREKHDFQYNWSSPHESLPKNS